VILIVFCPLEVIFVIPFYKHGANSAEPDRL